MLDKSEQAFDASIDGISVNIIVYQAVDGGEDFKILGLNKAVEKTENISKDERINKRLTKTFPAVKEFDLLDILKKVYNTGKSKVYEGAFDEKNIATKIIVTKVCEYQEKAIFQIEDNT